MKFGDGGAICDVDRLVPVFLDARQIFCGEGDGNEAVIEMIGVTPGRVYVTMPGVAVAAGLNAAASMDSDGIAWLEGDGWIGGSGLSRIRMINANDEIGAGRRLRPADEIECFGGAECARTER